jgi:hypothetical protein
MVTILRSEIKASNKLLMNKENEKHNNAEYR